MCRAIVIRIGDVGGFVREWMRRWIEFEAGPCSADLGDGVARNGVGAGRTDEGVYGDGGER
jgi:hypothetical protein